MAKNATLALCTQKGGTGKTTTSIEIAAYACARKRSVLLIDFDPQGSLSDVLGVDNDENATIYDVLTGDVAAPLARQKTSFGADIITANETLAYASGLADDFSRLKDAIAEARRAKPYDLVVIDCAPMPQTPAAFNALSAADWVLMPTLARRQAVKSLTKTIKTIQAFADANLGAPRIAGVALCDHFGQTRIGRAWQTGVQAFCDEQGLSLLEPAIRHSVVVDEAQSAHVPLSIFAPSHPATLDYRALCTHVLDIVEEVRS